MLRRQISGERPSHWLQVRLVNCAACLFKDEPVVFPPLKSHTLPSADAVRLVLRDCLGYSPFSPHTLSLEATCSPVYPPTPPPPSASCFFFFLLLCTNLSLVSTSKQKRLSMDSVLRRMQDLSVRCVRPCGGEAALETSFICSNRHRIAQYRVIIIISSMKQSPFHGIVKPQEVPLTCQGSVLKKGGAGPTCDVTAGTEHTHCQVLVPT